MVIGYPDLVGGENIPVTALQGGGYMRQVPNDPFSNIYTYHYTKFSNVTYCIGAFLERDNPNNCAAICFGAVPVCNFSASPVVFCNYCVGDP